MIMLVDSYGNDQYQRIFLYPASHTSEQTPQPNSIISYPMGQGASAYFNPDDNHLIIQDLTWNRISFISLNQPPVIRTKTLLNGYKGKLYQGKIKGSDVDKEDVLTINIANLPPGITQGQCKQDVKNDVKEIVCPIAGKPTAKGIYNVSVELSDSAGHSVFTILRLIIR
jgi:hypothetical protein